MTSYQKIRNRFLDFRSEPSDQAWLRLEERLKRHRHRRRSRITWLGMAASFLILIGLLFSIPYLMPGVGQSNTGMSQFYLEELGDEASHIYAHEVIQEAHAIYGSLIFSDDEATEDSNLN